MTRPADSASRLAPVLGGLGLAALGLVTLASPGATRMHAWPWSLAYAVALAIPAALLARRCFDRTHSLVVPARPWLLVALAGVAVLLLSSLYSPYRGPSLLWSTPLLAGLAAFFVAFDWLHATPGASEARRESLLRFMGAGFALVAVASIGGWAVSLPGLTPAQVIDARNPYPLGHSNYTAGLAVLMLPCFAALAQRSSGHPRRAWLGAGVLALAMLLTSGSRGGILGLGALLVGALLASHLGWKKSLVLVVAAAAVALLHPRTRAMFRPDDPAATLNSSNLQRGTMLKAGFTLGVERPLLGWGPGSTPLAFPRVRGGLLGGGVENVLQLHCLPVQVWAELGAAGLGLLAAGALLVLRQARQNPVAAVAVGGYLVFALTDYQLDVPVFTLALAAYLALLAPRAASPSPVAGRAVSLALRVAVVVLAAFARGNPTPELNLRALSLAQSPGQTDEAIELFRESLALNPDQEIAHFNLGWILIVRQPAEAEQHFLAAARLVPDKGGVYFGLGLARLNQGRRDHAVRAFALEGLNDPIFFTSPWWRDPALAPLRPATGDLARRLLAEAAHRRIVADPAAGREAAYLDALIPWLAGSASPGSSLRAAANTPQRTAFFSGQAELPPFDRATVHLYRRERTGYPVLMRNLDLPVPVDLFDVQENALATGEYRFLFPHKGWLPGSLLIMFMENRLL